MSRWRDRSIHDAEHSGRPNGRSLVVKLFGTRVAETILASVHVRAHQKAGHMDASDLIKSLPDILRGGARPHMGLIEFSSREIMSFVNGSSASSSLANGSVAAARGARIHLPRVPISPASAASRGSSIPDHASVARNV
jgi:hypothetical protein